MGSCDVVGFTRVRPGGRWVLSGSLGSLGCGVGLILSPWVHFCALSVSLSSSVVIGFSLRWDHPGLWGFILVQRGGRWVFPESLGSLVCAQGVVGFIRDHWVHTGSHCGSLGSSWVVGVHSDAPSGSLGSSGVVRYTRVRPGGRRFHPGVVGFTLVTPDCVLAHPVSFDSLGCALGSVGFIRFFGVYTCSPMESLGSFG